MKISFKKKTSRERYDSSVEIKNLPALFTKRISNKNRMIAMCLERVSTVTLIVYITQTAKNPQMILGYTRPRREICHQEPLLVYGLLNTMLLEHTSSRFHRKMRMKTERSCDVKDMSMFPFDSVVLLRCPYTWGLMYDATGAEIICKTEELRPIVTLYCLNLPS